MTSLTRLLSLILVLGLAACASSSKKSFPDSVDSTIESNQSDFDKCYEQALKQKRPVDPMPEGRVEISFTVSPSGTVTESNVLSSNVSNPKLERCVAETLRRIQFPSNKEGRLIQTSYPFDFAPKK